MARASALADLPAPAVPELRLLGRTCGVLVDENTSVHLSVRHAELLLALARAPDGIRLSDLAARVHPEAGESTVRAELVRLRRRLGAVAPEWVPLSRPYRLPRRLPVDADRVLDDLAHGHHRSALRSYGGEVLPTSQAPVVRRLRETVSGLLRDRVLQSGSVDALLEYCALPEVERDGAAWLEVLRRLPPRSPRRDAVVRHLEWIERDLA